MYLSIGQMAQLNRVSIQTLRLYDKMGILKPSYINPESGYRYYNILQCAKLDLIQNLKFCGLSLKEIKEYLEHENNHFLEERMKAEKQQVKEQLKALEEQKRAIQRTLDSLDRYRTAPPDGTITLEYIPERTIIVLDSRNNYFEQGLEIYEHSLLQLKHSLSDQHMKHLYYRNPGTIWRRDLVLKREFVSTEVYVNVEPEDFPPKQITLIPAGMYQCIYCNQFQKEKSYALKLLDRVEANGYTISGDYLCETILETPLFHTDERGMFLRLQVPVKF